MTSPDSSSKGIPRLIAALCTIDRWVNAAMARPFPDMLALPLYFRLRAGDAFFNFDFAHGNNSPGLTGRENKS